MYKLSPTCQVVNLDKIYEKYFGYPSKGFFVEVGAFDGEFVSNTSGLADHGWNGVYIEPIYEYYLRCLDRHNRNDVVVANVAIGLDECDVVTYRHDTMTTLSKDQVKRYAEIEEFESITEKSFDEEICQQMRLDTLMNKLEVPKEFDLLVVDVEGYESIVFQTFNLSEWNPKMIIVELEDEHPSFQKYDDLIGEVKKLRKFIEDSNYTPIYKDKINTVFVRNDFVK